MPPSPWEARAAERRASGIYPTGDDWTSHLQTNADGGVLKRARNLVLILLNDERFRGRLAFNSMSLYPELDGRPVSDSDVTHVRATLEMAYRVAPGKDLAQEALRVASEFSPYDPRRSYLGALQWDGVPRIAKVAETYFGAHHDLYPRFLAAFFVGAVARVYEPGCKLDTVLVLLGPQGFRKSTFFRVLFGRWFSDSAVEPGTKDGMLATSAAWGIEIPEVEHLTLSREDSVLKRFITSAVDTFRRPYASSPEPVPRSSVFVATTNERAYLRDNTGTGSRRWHTVEVFSRVDADELARDRDQLWAEAVMLYRRDGVTWLTDDEEAEREALAKSYYQGDPWEDPVNAYLLDADRLRAVKRDDGTVRWAVASNDLLLGAARCEARDLTQANLRRLAALMAQLGGTRTRQNFLRGNPPTLSRHAEHGYLLPLEWRASDATAAEWLRANASRDHPAD